MKKLFLIPFLFLALTSLCYAGWFYCKGVPCTDTVFSDSVTDMYQAEVFHSGTGHWGYSFTVGGSGITVCKVSAHFRQRVGGTPSPDTFHAEIWDNSGSAQVGGDSDSVAFTSSVPNTSTRTEVEFSWSSDMPSLSASTEYWVVIFSDWVQDTSIYCQAGYQNDTSTSADNTITGTPGSWTSPNWQRGNGKVYKQ